MLVFVSESQSQIIHSTVSILFQFTNMIKLFCFIKKGKFWFQLEQSSNYVEENFEFKDIWNASCIMFC